MWRAVVGAAAVQLERNGALYRVLVVVCSKTLDTADIVREAIYRQLRVPLGVGKEQSAEEVTVQR